MQTLRRTRLLWMSKWIHSVVCRNNYFTMMQTDGQRAAWRKAKCVVLGALLAKRKSVKGLGTFDPSHRKCQDSRQSDRWRDRKTEKLAIRAGHLLILSQRKRQIDKKTVCLEGNETNQCQESAKKGSHDATSSIAQMQFYTHIGVQRKTRLFRKLNSGWDAKSASWSKK